MVFRVDFVEDLFSHYSFHFIECKTLQKYMSKISSIFSKIVSERPPLHIRLCLEQFSKSFIKLGVY